MATKRAKKQAKKIRLRTAVRKVVVRIRRLEAKAPKDLESGSAEYWQHVAGGLSLAQLELAVEHVDRFNASENWYGRVDLFEVMYEALKTALLEKTLGLSEHQS